MTDTQPNIESMKATDTDLLLQHIKDWRAQRLHLSKCIDEAEKIVRERVGDLAPSSPPTVQPLPPWNPTYPQYPSVPPYTRPGSPFDSPIIWC